MLPRARNRNLFLPFLALFTVTLACIPNVGVISEKLEYYQQMTDAVNAIAEGPARTTVVPEMVASDYVLIPATPQEVKIRLIGVRDCWECPEWRAILHESAPYLRDLSSKNSLTLEFDTRRTIEGANWPDLLAYIWADGVLLNAEVLERGYAFYDDPGENDKYDQLLREAEQHAREARRGFWATPTEAPP